MDIEEAKAKLAKLERDIVELVATYESETKISCGDRITFERYLVVDGNPRIRAAYIRGFL